MCFFQRIQKRILDPKFAGFRVQKEREIRNWIVTFVTFHKRVQCARQSLKKWRVFHCLTNRQNSYSPIVLGRVGLDHECEAHAGNFSPRGQTNMRKLRLSLPNLRKIFNIVKFRRAYILERSLFQTTKGRSAHYY